MSTLRRAINRIDRERRAIACRAAVLAPWLDLSERAFIRQALSGRAAEPVPAFFPGILSHPSPTDAVSHLTPQAGTRIVAEANRILSHHFNLLGSGDRDLGEAIDWHCDFKTGYRWNSRTPCRDIRIPYGCADIKVPWELSRFLHLSVLGRAYRLTGDEKYPREFVAQVGNWVARNPFGYGVNWHCTMDVAIRACNWILAWFFFRESPAVTEEFEQVFLRSLHRHGTHIIHNLEFSPSLTSNHYLADVAGLLYIGETFAGTAHGRAWRTFARRELAREMSKQVNADGSDFEASTCYHRLALEIFFFSTLLSVVRDPRFDRLNFREVSDLIFGAPYTDRLHGMFVLVRDLLKPDGSMPQIGDNDSGRFHLFSERPILDMEYILPLGAVFFRDPALKTGTRPSEDLAWVMGGAGRALWQELSPAAPQTVRSARYPDAGWFAMRDGTDYCVVSCGPNGQNGNGGHSHNDKLGFELRFGGMDVFVDPGTSVYTVEPDWRNIFRSTASHNTVAIDDLEQNPFNPRELFRLPDRTRVVVRSWSTTGEYDLLDAEHDGYAETAGVIHRRRFLFCKNGRGLLLVQDILTGQGRHRCGFAFHTAAFTDVRREGDTFLLRHRNGAACRLILPTAGNTAAVVENGWYSPEYGVRIPTSVIRLSVETCMPFTHTFLVTRGGEPIDGPPPEMLLLEKTDNV